LLLRINLQVLIIIWWIGAFVATSALVIPVLEQYQVAGTIGWLIVIISTGLIINEIKRIKQESKKKEVE
jgi:4-hydroxybenzoate polyprenyltransferase